MSFNPRNSHGCSGDWLTAKRKLAGSYYHKTHISPLATGYRLSQPTPIQMALFSWNLLLFSWRASRLQLASGVKPGRQKPAGDPVWTVATGRWFAAALAG
jgi:hypothetical protein